MAARDRIHVKVRRALINDGWTITHDPFPLELEGEYVSTDLGAELTLAAERPGELIAVEIKSFVSNSSMRDFEMAVGQYLIYRLLLSRVEPERKLYLAISEHVFQSVFGGAIIQLVIREYSIPLLVVNQFSEEIVQWIP